MWLKVLEGPECSLAARSFWFDFGLGRPGSKVVYPPRLPGSQSRTHNPEPSDTKPNLNQTHQPNAMLKHSSGVACSRTAAFATAHARTEYSVPANWCYILYLRPVSNRRRWVCSHNLVPS